MTGASGPIVHLLRHGEVHNPEGILYGRLPGYHLSEVGRKMADRAAEYFAGRDVAAVIASPMERAQETAAPVAAAHDLPVCTDERIIESTSVFEGRAFGAGRRRAAPPARLAAPAQPVPAVVGRGVRRRRDPDARRGRARRATRSAAARRCSSATSCRSGSRAWPRSTAGCGTTRGAASARSRRSPSLTYDGDQLVSVDYTEPAADLLPIANTEERGA